MNLQISHSSLKLKPKKRIIREEIKYFRQNFDLLLLAIPAMIVMFLMSYMPMFGIIIAFKDYKFDLGIFGSKWVGFENFKFFFASSDAFRITRNTIGYNLIYIVLGTSVALLLAIFLNEIGRSKVKIYQTILFVPFFISWVVVGYLVMALMDSQNGFINHILTFIGAAPIDWYSESKYWPFILPFMNIWKGVGFSSLIYYAGIIGIDSELYEASEIDGANRIQMVFHITLPMLKRLVILLVILALGNIFRGDFGLHYFVPNNAGTLYPTTDIIDTYAYRALRVLGDIPMASAVSAFQSIVGMVTVIVANAVIKKYDKDSSLF